MTHTKDAYAYEQLGMFKEKLFQAEQINYNLNDKLDAERKKVENAIEALDSVLAYLGPFSSRAIIPITTRQMTELITAIKELLDE